MLAQDTRAEAMVGCDDRRVSLAEENITLRQALGRMRLAGDRQDDIPFLIQLVENPKFRVPGLEIFHGRVDLLAHDCIHIMLGRGMAPKDEAFVIGFTMGSTQEVGATEERLFTFIAGNFYPGVYRFTDEDIAVFRDALRLGFISCCAPLDRVAWPRFMSRRIGEVRWELGIETDLLAAYYRIEAGRYPDSPESLRLLNDLPPV